MDQGPFWSARRRLARADKHIADFKSETDAYFGRKPYAVVHEKHPGGTHVFHKIKFTESVPDVITDFTFDAVSNLRASLDHAVYPIVSVYARDRAEFAHFPIADTALDLNARLIGKHAKTFPPDIISLFRRLQPYKGGDGHPIWALNRVRRQAEHRITVHCNVSGSTRWLHAELIGGESASLFEFLPSSGENDVVFAISERGSNLKYDLNFTPFIAFGNYVDVAAGESVGNFLEVAREKACSAVSALEAEALRLGIF